MASLKDLRLRIASVKATQKITKAMQMVAAAKLRRAQLAAEAARPYASRMSSVLGALAKGMKDNKGGPVLLNGNGKDQVHLLIVCTAERGLCGGFNSSIARLARDRANALLSQGKQVKILCVGKKGFDVLRRNFKDKIIDVIDLRGFKQIGFASAEAIAERVLAEFQAGHFDIATLFYSRFKSVISQIPTAVNVIPAEFPEEDTAQSYVYDYEPEESEILADLLPRNIAVQIFRALLENAASEQGARMSAMDNATRNAGDMIRNLTLVYNKTRQAQITKELIEIVSGAEAL